jgi:hypothetical protein
MKAFNVARAEMETTNSEKRLRKALDSNIPAATNHNYDIGQKVSVV